MAATARRGSSSPVASAVARPWRTRAQAMHTGVHRVQLHPSGVVVFGTWTSTWPSGAHRVERVTDRFGGTSGAEQRRVLDTWASAAPRPEPPPMGRTLADTEGNSAGSVGGTALPSSGGGCLGLLPRSVERRSRTSAGAGPDAGCLHAGWSTRRRSSAARPERVDVRPPGWIGTWPGGRYRVGARHLPALGS